MTSNLADEPTRIRAAVQQAAEHLLTLQQDNGAWAGTNDAGPQPTAQVLVVEHVFHALTPRDAELAVQWLTSIQLQDGSYAASPSLTNGDIDATGLVIAGLMAAGVSAEDASLKRAQAWLDKNGGWSATQVQTRIYACAMGLLPAAELGKSSFLLRWIPRSDLLLARRFSFDAQLTLNLLQPIIRGMQLGHPLPPFGVFRFFMYGRTLKHLSHHQNTAGSWAGMVNATTLAIFALHYLDVQIWDPRMQAAFQFLQHCKNYGRFGMRVSPYTSENWNTAGAVMTLSRVPDLNIDPVINRATDFLLQQQNYDGVAIDWQNPAPSRSTAGGWSYGIGNQLTSDCDTTAYVMSALYAADADNPSFQGPMAAALELLLNMQNDGGGWPAFTHGLKDKPPGPMYVKPFSMPQGWLQMLRAFLCPPVEMGDPGWEDLTGRVLMALGKRGFNLDESSNVQQAIGFLRAQLEGQPAWWGRWEVNFITSSCYVIQGLVLVGLSPQDPMIQAVVQWIVQHQNDDGGWGESLETYAHPEQAGTGASAPAITALVVSALSAVGGFDKEAKAGVEWLLSRQQDDGTWQMDEPVAVMLPPKMFYYKYITGHCVVMNAIIDYQQSLKRTTH